MIKPKSYSQSSKLTSCSRKQSTTSSLSTRSGASSNKSQSLRFITNPKSTLFSYVLSNGPRSRRSCQYEGFGYDLSPGERHFASKTNDKPMKLVPSKDMEILRDGKRLDYLNRRYEFAPDDKYHYPEATSWRIGWQHNQ